MPIYEQSVNVRKMSPVCWYATWRILRVTSALHTTGLIVRKISEIGNFWY